MSDIDNVMMPHAPQRLLQLIDEAQDEQRTDDHRARGLQNRQPGQARR